jgi:hypothetical protein
MRLFALLAAICAFSQTALAQTPECRSVPDASSRLACYDKATPPVAPKAAQRTDPASKGDGTYVDSISAEDALMNARLKNICKGC